MNEAARANKTTAQATDEDDSNKMICIINKQIHSIPFSSAWRFQAIACGGHRFSAFKFNIETKYFGIETIENLFSQLLSSPSPSSSSFPHIFLACSNTHYTLFSCGALAARIRVSWPLQFDVNFRSVNMITPPRQD